MDLSPEAIHGLRTELNRLYGTDFDLTDMDLNEIGLFLLTSLAEGMKTRKYGKINKLH